MGMGMNGENANASEASNFRMRAAATDCVTVETWRRAESLPLCRSVWRIRVPLSEATDDRGTGLQWQLASVDTRQPSSPIPLQIPPR